MSTSFCPRVADRDAAIAAGDQDVPALPKVIRMVSIGFNQPHHVHLCLVGRRNCQAAVHQHEDRRPAFSASGVHGPLEFGERADEHASMNAGSVGHPRPGPRADLGHLRRLVVSQDEAFLDAPERVRGEPPT